MALLEKNNAHLIWKRLPICSSFLSCFRTAVIPTMILKISFTTTGFLFYAGYGNPPASGSAWSKYLTHNIYIGEGIISCDYRSRGFPILFEITFVTRFTNRSATIRSFDSSPCPEEHFHGRGTSKQTGPRPRFLLNIPLVLSGNQGLNIISFYLHMNNKPPGPLTVSLTPDCPVCATN